MSFSRKLALAMPLTLLGALAVAQQEETAPVDYAPVLEGVIVTSNPARSIALLKRAGAKRARPFRVGQEFAGYLLLEVARDSALVENAAGQLRLVLAGGEATIEYAAQDLSVPWIRRDFSKSTAAARLEKEMPVILSETRVTASVESGEVRGLTLTRLPDGTLLSESGLKLDDVILSINGEPLRGLDSLWELLARFKDEDELRLIVERRGAVVRLAYAFTN